MLKIINFTLLIILLVSVSTVMAGHGQEVEKKITVAPSGVEEKCLKLKPGQTLTYSFTSAKPLKFNLHYHLIEKTVFHVKEETSSRSEAFHPVEGQSVYCMEWRNAHEVEVELDYRYITD